MWTLTPAGERLLTEGTERIYTFNGTQHAWDRRWLLVLARVTEADRPARHLLRSRMRWAGFGSPSPGVWISTHLEREGELRQVLEGAGVLDDAHIFVAEHQGGELAAMVRQAWDLEEIERSYEAFVEKFSPQPSVDPLARLLLLVHAWRRFPLIDPALPAELLPKRWSGTTASDLFHRRHARWVEAARQEWDQVSERNLHS